MTSEMIAIRDARLEDAVRLHRMTTRQIYEYSQTWERPYRSIKDADRRITATGLRRFLRHHEEQGANERGAKTAFIKMAQDLHKAGWRVCDVKFEDLIKGAGLRTDCRFRARPEDNDRPDYLFRLEYEGEEKLSDLYAKMERYRDHRYDSKEPFRVPFVVKHKYILVNMYKKSGEIMAGRNAGLFLFAHYDDFLKRDTAKEPFWATHPKDGTTSLVSLIPATIGPRSPRP